MGEIVDIIQKLNEGGVSDKVDIPQVVVVGTAYLMQGLNAQGNQSFSTV